MDASIRATEIISISEDFFKSKKKFVFRFSIPWNFVILGFMQICTLWTISNSSASDVFLVSGSVEIFSSIPPLFILVELLKRPTINDVMV